MTTPVITFYPSNADADVYTRSSIRVQCIDDTVDLNPATFDIFLSVGGATLQAVNNGAILTPFAGTVTGDGTDHDNGIVAKILPLGGKWLPNAEYTVAAAIANTTPILVADTATFQTDSHTNFEDAPTAPDAIETILLSPALPVNLRMLQGEFMKACTSSGNKQVQARTTRFFAYSTDLQTVLASWVDPTLADVHLPDRRSPLAIHARMSKWIPRVRTLLNELTGVSKAGKDLLEKRVNHDNPVYVVSAFANIVMLSAVGKNLGWTGF